MTSNSATHYVSAGKLNGQIGTTATLTYQEMNLRRSDSCA